VKSTLRSRLLAIDGVSACRALARRRARRRQRPDVSRCRFTYSPINGYDRILILPGQASKAALDSQPIGEWGRAKEMVMRSSGTAILTGAFLALAALLPAQPAAAQYAPPPPDPAAPVGGAIVGGALGGIIGGALERFMD